ncbi:hypothetical protein D1872_81600 [compost metagenome]
MFKWLKRIFGITDVANDEYKGWQRERCIIAWGAADYAEVKRARNRERIMNVIGTNNVIEERQKREERKSLYREWVENNKSIFARSAERNNVIEFPLKYMAG